MMTEPVKKPDVSAELSSRRRKRSIVLALVLGGLVLTLYALTVVKFGPAILVRPL